MDRDNPTFDDALEMARRWTIGDADCRAPFHISWRDPETADVVYATAMAEAARYETAIAARWCNYASLLMQINDREELARDRAVSAGQRAEALAALIAAPEPVRTLPWVELQSGPYQMDAGTVIDTVYAPGGVDVPQIIKRRVDPPYRVEEAGWFIAVIDDAERAHIEPVAGADLTAAVAARAGRGGPLQW